MRPDDLSSSKHNLAKPTTQARPTLCSIEKILEGSYAIRLHKVNETGKWARVFLRGWTEESPQPSSTVHRLLQSSGLFILLVLWTWSREDLATRGIEIIYAVLDGIET
jgi:hypothetical protein